MPGPIEHRMQSVRASVEEALVRLMPPADLYPPRIHEAMSYAVLAGGKRLRPILLLSAAEVVGDSASRMMRAAAAIEFVHTASLMLDDLPCMDDAELRRSRPTVHKVFGEATAILGAISLLSYSFELVAETAAELRVRKGPATDAVAELGRAIGSRGLSAGQHVDLEIEKYGSSFESLEFIHSRKTGALFIAAARIGAILARASTLQLDALTSYAKNVGLAFQITDDILDAEGDPETLGKDVQKDKDKTTFVSLFGVEASRKAVHGLIETAKRSLALFGPEADLLRGLADFVAVRKQ
jgi:geranylgeranyl diphosphate synthase, type II